MEELTDLTDKALLDELDAAVHALRGDYVQQTDLEHYSAITAEIAHRLQKATETKANLKIVSEIAKLYADELWTTSHRPTK